MKLNRLIKIPRKQYSINRFEMHNLILNQNVIYYFEFIYADSKFPLLKIYNVNYNFAVV